VAHAENLDQNTLERITAGMQRFLGGLIGYLRPGVPLEIREAFKRFDLSLQAINDPSDKTLEERVHWLRQWHVQLFQGDEPVGYVLVRGDKTPVRVQGVFLASLAKEIDEAIQTLDAEEAPGDGSSEVDLLVAPSHQLHMLWIRRPERQIVALETDLKQEQPYAEEQILTLLRQRPPIVGLGPRG
jgi:hypothetical protein